MAEDKYTPVRVDRNLDSLLEKVLGTRNAPGTSFTAGFEINGFFFTIKELLDGKFDKNHDEVENDYLLRDSCEKLRAKLLEGEHKKNEMAKEQKKYAPIPMKKCVYSKNGISYSRRGFHIYNMFFELDKIVTDEYKTEDMPNKIADSYDNLRKKVLQFESSRYIPKNTIKHDGATGPPPPGGYERQYRGDIYGWKIDNCFLEKDEIVNEKNIPKECKENEKFMDELLKLKNLLISEEKGKSSDEKGKGKSSDEKREILSKWQASQ